MTPKDMTVTATRGTAEVPAWVAPSTDLARIDYVDCFEIPTEVDFGAEEWARALFGDRADATKRFLWTGLLGLKIQRRASRDLVSGWRIDAVSHDEIRLVAESTGMFVNLVVRCRDGSVGLATALRYRRRLGAITWRALSAVHRRLAPGLLREAAVSLWLRQTARSRHHDAM